MQVEPPGPDVLDHRLEPVGALRLSAAVAAGALAVASSGHLLVLGALLAVVARTRAGATAAMLATSAVLVRWGAPTLSAAGGAQAVLGPAATVGSTSAAASAILAALAIALLTPARRDREWDLVIIAGIGLVVGAVLAGPTLPNDVPVRVAGAVVGIALAFGATLLPRRLVGVGACASGAVALLLAVVA